MPGIIADVPGDYIQKVEIKLDGEEFKAVYEIPFEITEAKGK